MFKYILNSPIHPAILQSKETQVPYMNGIEFVIYECPPLFSSHNATYMLHTSFISEEKNQYELSADTIFSPNSFIYLLVFYSV